MTRLRQIFCSHADTTSASHSDDGGRTWIESYWKCNDCGKERGKPPDSGNNAVFPGGLEGGEPVDLGVVTHVCICGSSEWKVVVSFDDYEVATVSTEMYCRWCSAKAVTPTPLDRPGAGGQD